MTKFRVTNGLLPSMEGHPLSIVSVFGSFEEMTDKVVKDLNSLWKGVVPFPLEFKLETVGDDVESGTSLWENGVLVGKTTWMNGEYDADSLEKYSSLMNDYFDKRYLKSGEKK